MIEKLFKLIILLSLSSCAGTVWKEVPNEIAMRIDQANSPFQALSVSPIFNNVELQQKKVWLIERLGKDYPNIKNKIEESYKLLLNIKKVSSFKFREGDPKWVFEDDKAYYGFEWKKKHALVHARREVEKTRWAYKIVVRTKAINSKNQSQIDYIQKQIAELRLQHRKPSYEAELRELEEKFYELAHQYLKADSFSFHPRFVVEKNPLKSRILSGNQYVTKEREHLLLSELGLE